MQEKPQKIAPYFTLARWAHLTKKIDIQSPGTDIHKMGAHLAVSRTKGGARGGTWGAAEPWGRPAPCWRQMV